MAALVALSGTAWLFLRDEGINPDELASKRVVVAPFQNQTGDRSLDPLGRMATDWITRGLTETGQIAVVDLPAESPSGTRASGPAALRSLANQTGAGVVVTGSFYRQGDSVLIVADIHAPRQGKRLRSLGPVKAPVSGPLPAVEQLGRLATGTVASLLDSRSAEFATVTSQPPSYEAYRAMMEAEDALTRSDGAAAERAWIRAASLDSGYLHPRLSLATIGPCPRTDSLGRFLQARRERLSEYDWHSLERSLAKCRGDAGGEYRAVKKMAEAAPGSDGAAFRHATAAAYRANRPREALAIIERLDHTRGWLGTKPGYYRVLSDIYHQLGRYKEELRSARRGVAQHPDAASSFAYSELRALAALGRIAELNHRLQELARPIEGQGWTMLSIADELHSHGHRTASRVQTERALVWLWSHPSERAKVDPWILVHALTRLDRTTEAAFLIDSLVIKHPNNYEYETLRAVLAARRGDRATAERVLAQIALRETPAAGRANAIGNRATITAQLGRRDEAVQLIEQALRQGMPRLFVHYNLLLEPLWGYSPFERVMQPEE